MSDADKEIGDIKVRLSVAEKRQDASEKRADDYVTKDQFAPVRILVYGFAGLVLSSAVMALLAKVIIR